MKQGNRTKKRHLGSIDIAKGMSLSFSLSGQMALEEWASVTDMSSINTVATVVNIGLASKWIAPERY